MILPIQNLKESNFQSYSIDSGVDINVPLGTPVYAAAGGTIVYSESGHTPWVNPPDTPGSILILLDHPIQVNGIFYYYHWYTHLSYRRYNVADGSGPKPTVKEGDEIGRTGLGNKVPHLHFGMLIDRAQNDGDFMPAMELQDYLLRILHGDVIPTPDVTPQVDRIKMFYTKGKPLTVIVDGKSSEPESITFEIVTKKEQTKMVNEKNLLIGAVKAEVKGIQMNILNTVLNLLLKMVPTVLSALADGRIDAAEQREIISELGAGIAEIAGKPLTEEEMGKLYDAAVILVRLASK